MLICFSLGMTAVFADDVTEEQPAETPAKVEFRVEDGAYVRTENDDNGGYGIKFVAYVGDDGAVEGATYKMMIVPSTLIDAYNSDTTENKSDIVTWLKAYAKGKGGSLVDLKGTPNNQGYYAAAITDIYWVNLNRDFSAIAYYEKDSAITVAKLAEDGKRSITTVAQNGINSNVYEETSDEYKAMQSIVSDGTESKNHVVMSSSDDKAFSIHNTLKGGSTTEYVINWKGSVESVSDFDGKGNAWKITLTEKVVYDHAQLKWNNETYKNRFKGYDTVKFSFYRPIGRAGYKLITCEEEGYNKSVKIIGLSQGWNEIIFSVSDLEKSLYYLIVYPFDSGVDEGGNVYYITDFKAYTATEMAQEAIDMIDALPAVENLTGIDGTKISAARTAYDALSEKAQAKVTNYSTLTALETAYNEKFVVIFDMTDISGFSVNNDTWGNGACTTLSKGYDEEYGNYLNIQLTNATHDQLTILYPKTDLDSKLEGCDKVYFYVWNGETEGRSLFANFGGTVNTSYKASLEKDAWVLVEVPVTDFKNGTVFGFSWVNGQSGIYKFSMFWATKTAE